MAGDSEIGGGTSVHWKVDATNVNKGDTNDNHGGSQDHGTHHQHGRDQDGKIGSNFTVSIKLPNGWSRDKFTGQMSERGGRIEFELPIEVEPNQIRVRWS
jgi:hypothetical protein